MGQRPHVAQRVFLFGVGHVGQRAFGLGRGGFGLFDLLDSHRRMEAVDAQRFDHRHLVVFLCGRPLVRGDVGV